MHYDTGRLIEDYEIVVLIHDIQRQLVGLYRHRFRRQRVHFDRFALRNPISGFADQAVHLDPTGDDPPLDRRSTRSGNSLR